MQLCNITGTAYDKFGNLAPWVELRVLKVEKNGVIIDSHRKDTAADASGHFAFGLPRNCFAWVWAPIEGLNGSKTTGVKLAIPDAATANLEDLLPPIQGTPPASYVYSWNGRTGNVLLLASDITTALGYTPAGGGTDLTAVAGEALGGHRAVRLVSGQAFYADQGNPAKTAVIGITTGAANLGATVTIATAGEIIEPSWSWTPQQAVFLSTNGVLTQTPPMSGALIEVGLATAATKLHVRIQPKINLV